MQPGQWAIILSNSLVAGLLLFASFAKLVSPAILARSLILLTRRESLSTNAVVRVIGITEALVAVGLMVPVLRLAAAVAAGALGVTFAISGVTAHTRHINEPCGCFGVMSHQPLGWLNVTFGAIVMADAVLNFIIRGNLATEYAAKSPVFAGILICGVCLVSRPQVIRAIFR